MVQERAATVISRLQRRQKIAKGPHLLDLDQPVCTCAAKADLARDKAELRNGAVFLLEEISCRAALSIELPRAPQSEELPDAQVAALIRETFGATDELSDDSVAPAE